MVSEKKKLNRVISFLKKGLVGLTDDLEETVKNIKAFIESLNKAEKDLKEVTIKEEVQTVSTSSAQVVAPSTTVKTAAASTLFSLLSGSQVSPLPAPPGSISASAAPKPPSSGPPSAPPGAGPPRAPSGGGPPRAPPGGGPPSAPPRAPNLPPAPTLPGAGPPRAPPGGAPQMSPQAPPMAAKPGGGLSSLRDEMLDELNRLKKIMRGE